jgi:hypothetical protein
VLGALAGGCGNDDGEGRIVCERGTVLRDGACVPVGGGGTRPGEGDGEDIVDGTPTDTAPPPATDTGLPPAPTDTGVPPDTGGGTGPCLDGAVRCSPAGIPQRCVGGTFEDQAPCAPSDICLAGTCTAGVGCTPGDIIGCASETAQQVCNASGSTFEPRACDDGLFCFQGTCGTQRCAPAQTRCLDDFQLEVCSADGTFWFEGETCERDRVCSGGECVSGCAAVSKESTYIGCEYWTVDLPQYEDPATPGPRSPHSVVLANVGEFSADIQVESFANRAPDILAAPTGIRVPPGSADSITFPRADVDIIPALTIDGTGISSRSFRITASEPLVAYQFNPLNNAGVASNDASLLLPINAIGREYLVMGWVAGVPPGAIFGNLKAQRAFLTVVAPSSGSTRVAVTTTADVLDGPGITGFTRGTTRVFTLEQGQVLNLETESRLRIPPRPEDLRDFTGTYVDSDRPILVFAGHEQAVIGEEGENGSCCADHLEEQMFPISGWGNRYMAVHSPPRGEEPDYWRVMAAQPNTRIVTNPPIDGLHNQTLNRGQFIEVRTNQSFEIEATGPVLVGQYLVSQQTRGISRTIGDPSFILAVPLEAWRDFYVVLTPRNYREDYLTIIRPVGVRVTLDANPIPDAQFTAFGTRTHEFTHQRVEPGPHRVFADAPIAVMGYGYDSAVSYGYPAGLNITQPVED